jgi:hypothetical protein
MFRGGGKVNSVGTGITSGLVDREEYRFGGGPTGMQPNIPQGDTKTILDYIQSGSGTGPSGPRGRIGVSDYIQPSAGYGGQSITDVLGYEPTGKPFQGQPSFRSMNTPDVYTAPKAEEKSVVTARQAEDESMKNLNENEIKLDDIDEFEESVKKKAEVFNRILGLEDERKQSLFRGLTKGGLKTLQEGDIAAGAEAFSEEVEAGRKAAKKGISLALEEQIKKDLLKDPDKIREIDALVEGGVSKDEAIKIVYGTEGSKLLPGYTYERELTDLRKVYAEKGDNHQQAYPTGYAQSEILLKEGITPVKYEYDIKAKDYIPTNIADMKSGEVRFDPVSFQYFVVSPSGQKTATFNKAEALAIASGK